MGKVYFMMGDTKRAKAYHQRFFEGFSQPKDTAVRVMSK